MGELWDIYDRNRNKTGRFHERGMPMKKGEYHLTVQVWILNSSGEFLITKRSPSLSFWANRWHATGGCAIAGDDSLQTALKEVREELGISLDPANGQLFTSYTQPHYNDEGNIMFDIWLFRQDIDLSTIVLQEEEICDAKWADKQEICSMIDTGSFIPISECPYLDELFAFCNL